MNIRLVLRMRLVVDTQVEMNEIAVAWLTTFSIKQSDLTANYFMHINSIFLLSFPCFSWPTNQY